MSQINVSNQVSSRGKEIQDHPYSINLESRFHRLTRSIKQEEDEDVELDVCPYCNYTLQEPYWEPRDKGKMHQM